MNGITISRVNTMEISNIFKKYIFFLSVLNVAAGKAPMQSSVVDGGIPQKAVDGSTSRLV